MSDLDRITTIEVGLPGPSGAGITALEKTDFDARLDALEALVGLIVQDEGTPLATRGTTLNFTGAGVTASGTGADKTINVPGGALTIEVDNAPFGTGITTLDFDSKDFTVTESPADELNITKTKHGFIHARKTMDSGFSTVTTSEATVDSVEIGPLVDGITYDIDMHVHIRGGPTATGFLRVYAKIAGDSSIAGERTGTVNGERSCMATSRKLSLVGDGVTTYTLAARADMDTGTGTINSCHIWGVAIPQQ